MVRTSLSDAFHRAGLDVVPGAVYRVRDKAVTFPQERTGQRREKHPTRYALVLSNELICTAVEEPVVLIAPMSHEINVGARSDIVVDTSQCRSLKRYSRAILSHVQPLLREELEEKLGYLSTADLDKVKAKLVWTFNLDE